MPEPERLVVLVDDVRSFRDQRPAIVLRSASAAVAYLREHHDGRLDELWLDHDLAGPRSTRHEDTAMPVVDELVQAALRERPYDIGCIYLHSVNASGAFRMRRALQVHYRVIRHHTRIWTT